MKNPETFNQACYEVAREIADLVIKKQHDYGHSNIEKFGEWGIVIRSSDKQARLENLLSPNAETEPSNETIEDNW